MKNAFSSENATSSVISCSQKRCFAPSELLVSYPGEYCSFLISLLFSKTVSISAENFNVRDYPLLWFKLYGLKTNPGIYFACV